jgi:hypothetical protein
MTQRVVSAATFLILAAGVAVAQSPLDRGPRRGFDFAVVPGFALGFNAIRSFQTDSTACTGDQTHCLEYAMGNAPSFSLDITVPLGRFFGLSVGGAAGQPQRVVCVQGNNCQATSTDRLTVLRGNGLLLFRLKPQAPVFIGVGYGAARINPGSLPWQDSMVVEKGPVAELAFDFALGEQVGFRIAWWNYWLAVDASGIGNAAGIADCRTSGGDGCFTPETTAHDQMFTFAARIRLLK